MTTTAPESESQKKDTIGTFEKFFEPLLKALSETSFYFWKDPRVNWGELVPLIIGHFIFIPWIFYLKDYESDLSSSLLVIIVLALQYIVGIVAIVRGSTMLHDAPRLMRLVSCVFITSVMLCWAVAIFSSGNDKQLFNSVFEVNPNELITDHERDARRSVADLTQATIYTFVAVSLIAFGGTMRNFNDDWQSKLKWRDYVEAGFWVIVVFLLNMYILYAVVLDRDQRASSYITESLEKLNASFIQKEPTTSN